MAKATVRSEIGKLNIRNAMSTAPGTDVGDLFPGDIMEGNVLGNWFAFTKVTRGQDTEIFPSMRYAALANPLNLNEKYLDIDTSTEPTPPTIPPAPTLPILELTIGGSYTVVTLENRSNGIFIQLQPK